LQRAYESLSRVTIDAAKDRSTGILHSARKRPDFASYIVDVDEFFVRPEYLVGRQATAPTA